MKPIATLFQKPERNIMAEIGRTAANMTDVIDLSIGDPDLATPKPIAEAAKRSIDEGKTHYTASNGEPTYLQSVLDMHRRLFDQSDYSIENIWATAGATHALNLALGALLDPGDEVIIPAPYFTPYKVQVESYKGVPVVVDTKAAEDFQPQKEAIEAAIGPKTKAILVNSPNNPTGTVYSRKTLEDIAELARTYDLYLLADEVYWPYAFGGADYVPLENLAPERTLVLGSLSKVFAMTGFRCGYLLGPEPVISAAGLLNEGVCYSAPTTPQWAGSYGMDHLESIIPPLQHTFDERLTYLAGELGQLDWINVIDVRGSIYLFIDISGSGMDDIAFSDYLLEQAHILVIPGQAFDSAGRGFVRIAATRDITQLEQAVKRFRSLRLPDVQ